MKQQAWIAAVGTVALLVASCGSPEATNPLQKYAGNPDYVIGKSAVRCTYFFDMVRAGTKYSYENHQFLAPQMITDEYLMIMQSTYEREYRNQLESHRKGMNDKTYSNLFKSISNFYFQKIGASKPDINLYLENVGPSENSDMIRIISAFGRGNLNFEQYKDLYEEINQIGGNIDCALLQDGTYKEFLSNTASASGEAANGDDSPADYGTATSTIRAFYSALGSGEGGVAASMVVPEKTASGPFSAKELTRYYGNMRSAIELLSVSPRGANAHTVRYKYAVTRTVCNGRAVVEMTKRDGRNYIARIRALDGC